MVLLSPKRASVATPANKSRVLWEVNHNFSLSSERQHREPLSLVAVRRSRNISAETFHCVGAIIWCEHLHQSPSLALWTTLSWMLYLRCRSTPRAAAAASSMIGPPGFCETAGGTPVRTANCCLCWLGEGARYRQKTDWRRRKRIGIYVLLCSFAHILDFFSSVEWLASAAYDSLMTNNG